MSWSGSPGAHVVTGVAGAGLDEDEVLGLAGAVEADSEHPLARAIVAAARERGRPTRASEFRSITGRGVEATVDGQRYGVGGPALLRERGLQPPPELVGTVAEWERRGAAVLYLVRGEEVLGVLSLEDEMRPEARQAVAQLRAGQAAWTPVGEGCSPPRSSPTPAPAWCWPSWPRRPWSAWRSRCSSPEEPTWRWARPTWPR